MKTHRTPSRTSPRRYNHLWFVMNITSGGCRYLAPACLSAISQAVSWSRLLVRYRSEKINHDRLLVSSNWPLRHHPFVINPIMVDVRQYLGLHLSSWYRHFLPLQPHACLRKRTNNHVASKTNLDDYRDLELAIQCPHRRLLLLCQEYHAWHVLSVSSLHLHHSLASVILPREPLLLVRQA